MDINPRGDVSKLPVWAQRYIAVLESNVAGLEKQIAAVGDKDLTVNWSRLIGPGHGIPADATVEFNLKDGGAVRFCIDGNAINVNSSNRHLMVAPVASNAVFIRLWR